MTRVHLSTTQRRALRTRRKLGKGSATKPRLSVNRSNTQLTAQLIDDSTGNTLAFVSTAGNKGYNVETCAKAGEQMAKLMNDKGITELLFDRGSSRYHGKVKAFADGVRAGGIKF